MTDEDKRDLWMIRSYWLGLYAVALSDGAWIAVRDADVTRVLTAGSASGLDELINLDYAEAVLAS
jgi:hypothetical protein